MSIQDKLYEKLSLEYQSFIDELKVQPVDSIIDRAAEKTFKQDILFFFEENDLDPPEAEVLLALDNTLDAVYQAWGDVENTYMDRLSKCIEDKAAELTALQVEQPLPTAKTLFKDVKHGDWVIAAGNNDYRYLLGRVTAIDKLGSSEHNTDNQTDDIHVDFTAFEYPPERIAEIEEQFSSLYGEAKAFGELPLDDVIMAPKMLISISNLSLNEIESMRNLRENCEAFCNCFPGSFAPTSEKHAELVNRLEKNYADYNESLLNLDRQEIIKKAGEIRAVSDAYTFMRACHEYSSEDLDFFLQFQNPLEIVAHERHERLIDLEDMGAIMDFVTEPSQKERAMEMYPLTSDSDVSKDNEQHQERSQRMRITNSSVDSHLQKTTDGLTDVRKPFEQEKSQRSSENRVSQTILQPKPTLEEKLKAANEKVQKQDNNNKSHKRKERD